MLRNEIFTENDQFQIYYNDQPTDENPEIEVRYFLRNGQTEEDLINDWDQYGDDIKARVDSIIATNNDVYGNFEFSQKFSGFTKQSEDEIVYFTTNYVIN